MRRIILSLILLFICLLYGCSSKTTHNSNTDIDSMLEESYSAGYEEGYNSGYEDGLNYLNIKNYEAEYHDFELAIIDLMYDYEYETVEKIFNYYPDGVVAALENEFGTSNMTVITDFLDKQADTVFTTCKFCNKVVYAKDAIHLFSECNTDALHKSSDCPTYSYVHRKCYIEHEPPKVNKVKP